jgi:purine nucleosidase
MRLLLVIFATCLAMSSLRAQTAAPVPATRSNGTQKIIIDTDIGDDIDDAFAVGLALHSPEFQILGISSAFGDTHLRARLLSRFLKENGRSDIPIAVGIPKQRSGRSVQLTQAAYAEGGPADQNYPNAVDFLLDQIKRYPGEISLLAIGPETNLAAAIDRDPTTFRKLKRIVLMGGSVYYGYSQFNYGNTRPAEPEWNILCDIQAAQKVFTSGVPLYVMPLDSTQIKLQELERAEMFKAGTPLSDALLVLYEQWSHGTGQTPTLFDAVVVAYATHPELCPTRPMRLQVDAQGFTRPEAGQPNTNVCLHSSSDQFLEFFMPRILQASTPATAARIAESTLAR